MKYLSALFLLLAPAITFAQGTGSGTLAGIVTMFGGIVNSLIPIFIGLALLTFIWGVLSYIIAKDDATKQSARGVMIYGIIGLFVIVSIWGIVGLLRDSLGVEGDSEITAPSIN